MIFVQLCLIWENFKAMKQSRIKIILVRRIFILQSLCWLHLGDGKKALMDAEACRMMRPDWPKACYRQGAALMLLKDYKKACSAFLDGLMLQPENIEMKNAFKGGFAILEDVRQP